MNEEREKMKKASAGSLEGSQYIIRPFNDMEKVCDNPVIATPYYSMTLKQRIKQWKGNEKRIKTFTKRLLTGVAHFQTDDIKLAHRDLKADNILIGDDDKPIIIDFGLANSKNFASGTACNLAPEQKKSEKGPFGGHHKLWW